MKNYRYSLFEVLNCPKLQHEVNSKYLVNKLNPQNQLNRNQ